MASQCDLLLLRDLLDSALGQNSPKNDGQGSPPRALPRMVYLNERRVRSIEHTHIAPFSAGHGNKVYREAILVTLVPEPQKTPLVLQYRFAVQYDPYTIILHNQVDEGDLEKLASTGDQLTCRKAGAFLAWNTF